MENKQLTDKERPLQIKTGLKAGFEIARVISAVNLPNGRVVAAIKADTLGLASVQLSALF